MTSPIDVEYQRRWIGAAEKNEDVVTAALVERFRATLSLEGSSSVSAGDPAPRLIHFCLGQRTAPMEDLGEDGHAARGGFLPPVPLPRRMWAGSRIRFHGDLCVGDTVTRRSRIADVAIKTGRTGPLCFVAVDHSLEVNGEVRVEDRQTIVYRELQEVGAGQSPAPALLGATTVGIDVTPVLLFRYSALTFNGHRIHYDAPYASEVEGYPGLVVHGPLQATLLFHLSARLRGREPDSFTFRSLSPLFGGDLMLLHAGRAEEGPLALWTSRSDGPTAMEAEANWS